VPSLVFCDDTKNEQGQVVRSAFQNAINLANLGGKLLKIKSAQNKGVVWGVFK